MATLIKEHWSITAQAVIPSYWQPDNAKACMPCDTKGEAETVERIINVEADVEEWPIEDVDMDVPTREEDNESKPE